MSSIKQVQDLERETSEARSVQRIADLISTLERSLTELKEFGVKTTAHPDDIAQVEGSAELK